MLWWSMLIATYWWHQALHISPLFTSQAMVLPMQREGIAQLQTG